MVLSTDNSVNCLEFLTLRTGYSIYTGWMVITVALNVTFIFKSFGMEDPKDILFNEEDWAVIILWTLALIYILCTIYYKNPLVGAIYIWVLIGVKTYKKEYEFLQKNVLIIMIIHSVFIVGYTAYAIYKRIGYFKCTSTLIEKELKNTLSNESKKSN